MTKHSIKIVNFLIKAVFASPSLLKFANHPGFWFLKNCIPNLCVEKVTKPDTNRSCFMVEIVLNSLWHLGPDGDTKIGFFFSPSFHSKKFIAQLIYLLGQFLFYYYKSSNIFCIILSPLWFLHFALGFFVVWTKTIRV